MEWNAIQAAAVVLCRTTDLPQVPLLNTFCRHTHCRFVHKRVESATLEYYCTFLSKAPEQPRPLAASNRTKSQRKPNVKREPANVHRSKVRTHACGNQNVNTTCWGRLVSLCRVRPHTPLLLSPAAAPCHRLSLSLSPWTELQAISSIWQGLLPFLPREHPSAPCLTVRAALLARSLVSLYCTCSRFASLAGSRVTVSGSAPLRNCR